MMLTTESASQRLLPKCLLACNIYVSTGQERWSPILVQLLEEFQQECTRLRRGASSSSSSSLALVHAYADGQYDRSSFHVAGSATLVAGLASHIASRAASTLFSLRQEQEEENKFQASGESAKIYTHPTVGLVDHVSVLPLSQGGQVDEQTSVAHMVPLLEWARTLEMDCSCSQSTTATPIDYRHAFNPSNHHPTEVLPSGWAARTVGHALEQVGVQVFWYGHADPHHPTPLAQVRKEKTDFFKSHFPLLPRHTMGQATVGAPMYFQENYNIQVATRDKRRAQELTQWVRSREGKGLPFVEALTLPHGTTTLGRENAGDEPIPVWEVACNLLNPTVTSTKDIDARVQTWVDSYGDDNGLAKVLSSYRVGTTVDMCMKALDETSTPEREEIYNQKVRDAFQGFLKDSQHNFP